MSSAQHPPPSGVGAVLEYLGRLPRHEPPLEGLLQRVTDLVQTVLPGSPEASVTLLVDLDEAQYAHGHGPCLHAAATWEVADVPDTRVESRWPDYARRAVARGTLSSLSVPLVIDDPQVSGALNIYAGRPHAFDQAGRSAAIRIAPFAAVAAGNLSRHRRALQRAADLEAALAARAVIEQAKGILMERHNVTAHGAFRLLARASLHTHMTVRRLAEHLVHTGELRCR